MGKVVVELVHHQQVIQYAEVPLAKAKEILGRKMLNGYRWHIPAWQFDPDGCTPESELQGKQTAAYKAVREAH